MSQNYFPKRHIINSEDLEQFQCAYRENFRKMHSVAYKMVNDSAVADDIVQEVFVYFLEKLKKNHEIRNTGNWLLRATINNCIDHNGRKKMFSKIEAIENQFSADELMEKRDKMALVRMGLSKLNSRERSLLVLYSEGYSYKEISKLTGIRFSSIGKKLSRSLKKLEKEIKNLDYELY